MVPLPMGDDDDDKKGDGGGWWNSPWWFILVFIFGVGLIIYILLTAQ